MAFGFDRLADYFTAVAALDAANDPEKQIAIAALLGLHDSVAKAPPVLQTPVQPPAIEPALIQPETKPPAAARQTPEPARPASRQPARIQHTVTRRPPRSEPPEWLEHVKALPPPRAVVVPPPAPAPLFAPRWSRAILSTAMSKDAATNTVDVEAMVDAIARGIPMRRVPRRIVPTLRHGVQLLVDRGPSSPPFHKDQELLVQQIQVVAGNDRVQVLRFDPSRGFLAGKGPRTRWEPYFDLTPPLPAMTIVVISDLGIARVPHQSNARAPQWRDFFARLHSRGHRVIVFVPFAPARWPPLPRGLAHLVPWDRRTSVQLVRKIVGRRRRRMVIG